MCRRNSDPMQKGKRKEENTISLETKLAQISEKAKETPKVKFHSLAHHLSKETLKICYGELKKGKAAGVDGISVEEYGKTLDANLEGLVGRMKGRKYYPQAVKRVYIPKSGNELRGLGIPAVEDKIVQMGMKKIMESIYEADFLDVSYGFRPGRSCHMALRKVDTILMKERVNFVVDLDIHKFFDNVNQKKLVELMSRRITDRSWISLIVRTLRSGIMEEGEIRDSKSGTPQGGVISPLLANIYLHYALDEWYEDKFKPESRGYSGMVRYADDVVLFFEEEEEAERFMREAKARLYRFGLEINGEKCRIIRFGRKWWRENKSGSFDFLGFTHYCDKSRAGWYKVGRKTKKRSFQKSVCELSRWLKVFRNSFKFLEIWKMMSLKMRGHFNYFGVSGNSRALNRYHNKALYLIFKWMNRRSQMRSFNWEEFHRLLKTHLLPKPRIYHSFYSLA